MKPLFEGRDIVKQFSLPEMPTASDSSAWASLRPASRIDMEISRPITEAISSTCFAVLPRRSMRAATTACTVAGNGIASMPPFSR